MHPFSGARELVAGWSRPNAANATLERLLHPPNGFLAKEEGQFTHDCALPRPQLPAPQHQTWRPQRDSKPRAPRRTRTRSRTNLRQMRTRSESVVAVATDCVNAGCWFRHRTGTRDVRLEGQWSPGRDLNSTHRGTACEGCCKCRSRRHAWHSRSCTPRTLCMPFSDRTRTAWRHGIPRMSISS